MSKRTTSNSRLAMAGGPKAPDQRVRRGVMSQVGLVGAPELGRDPLRERLPELDPPLVEGVDPPDRGLREDAVLVERYEAPERGGLKALHHDRVRGAVSLHHPVGYDRLRGPLGAHLVGGAAERQRLALREHVRQQQLVVLAKRVEGLRERDEVARDQARSLVEELVEGVLAVGARLAPEDRP